MGTTKVCKREISNLGRTKRTIPFIENKGNGSFLLDIGSFLKLALLNFL
jgi:hypothetical protein